MPIGRRIVNMKTSQWLRNIVDKHECRALVISSSFNSPFRSKPSPFLFAWNLPLGATHWAHITKLPSLMRRVTCGERGSSQAAVMKSAHNKRVHPNDIVIFANQLGTWKVVASVNGSKVDIRRNGGFDTRIVTARLESLTLIRCAGSPEYSY